MRSIGQRMTSPATAPSTNTGLVFADPVVATAILDRLLHHSHVVAIRGDSYRLREKPRAALVEAASPDKAPACMTRPNRLSRF
jgi:hypothetical protein